MCVCVCVCKRERKRERTSERAREGRIPAEHGNETQGRSQRPRGEPPFTSVGGPAVWSLNRLMDKTTRARPEYGSNHTCGWSMGTRRKDDRTERAVLITATHSQNCYPGLTYPWPSYATASPDTEHGVFPRSTGWRSLAARETGRMHDRREPAVLITATHSHNCYAGREARAHVRERCGCSRSLGGWRSPAARETRRTHDRTAHAS